MQQKGYSKFGLSIRSFGIKDPSDADMSDRDGDTTVQVQNLENM
jgi:hypothetical protein